MKMILVTRCAAAFSLLLSLPSHAQTPSAAFTLSVDSAIDGGLSYTDFTKGESAETSQYAIGFEVDITSVDGNAIVLDSLAAFCTEIEEPISITSYTGFEVVDLEDVSSGRAGESGTASAGIPAGGIGATRAGRVRYLFDNYYQDMVFANWDNSTVSNSQAFQLALWEITHDGNLDLSGPLGDMYVGTQASQSGNDAIALAQTWLDAIDTAGIGGEYQSQTYYVWALADDDNVGLTGNQDVLAATEIGSVQHAALIAAMPVPEPSSAVLILLGGLLMARRNRS